MNRKLAVVLLILLFSLFVAACAVSPAPAVTLPPTATQPPPSPTAITTNPAPRPTIIDTDMAPDDWMAILYLLQHPDVDVKAITVTGAGEAHCGPGVQNALRLTLLAGQQEIPVACGRETPLAGDHVFPQSWRDWSDGLSGLTLPDNPTPPSTSSAVELLVATIRNSPQKITLIALGPLTNVAEALEAEPLLADDLSMITIMGGAVHVQGNVAESGTGIDNQVAEWNIYIDPLAAAIVFTSGAPITLVPLDACNHVQITEDFYNRLAADRATPVADFVYRILTQSLDFIRSGGYYFWDPLAAAIATDESLGTFEERTLTIIQGEGAESGRTLVTPDGSSIRVTTSADEARFESLFLDTLNGRLP